MLEGKMAFLGFGILIVVIVLIARFIKSIIKAGEEELKKEREKILYEMELGNLNSYDEFGYTLLIRAIHYGFTDLVKKLIEKGANVNYKSSSNAYPIHYAASSGDEDIVRQLINNGADVDALDKDGVTALMIAARMDNKKIASLLLEEGADVNKTEKINGYSALIDAAKNASFNVYDVLINNGADVFIKSKSGENAYEIGDRFLASNLGPSQEINFNKTEMIIGLGYLIRGKSYEIREYVRDDFNDDFQNYDDE